MRLSVDTGQELCGFPLLLVTESAPAVRVRKESHKSVSKM